MDAVEHSRAAYIEGAGDDIPIHDVLKEYEVVVLTFHVWFRGALQERHRQDLEALVRAEQDVKDAWEQPWGDPCPSRSRRDWRNALTTRLPKREA